MYKWPANGNGKESDFGTKHYLKILLSCHRQLGNISVIVGLI